MEIISGKKEYFFKFLDDLKKEDRIAVICHNDLDGIASGIIINEILKSKKLKPKIIQFITCEGSMFGSLIKKLKNKKINKILIADLAVDTDYEGYKKIDKGFDSFSIDHHEFKYFNEKNMIKTRAEDCATFSLFQLAKEYLPKEEMTSPKLAELVCATMIIEFSYKDEENKNFIKSFYPEINPETAYNNSELGEICKKVSSALIYFEGKEIKIFKTLLKIKLDKLNKYSKIVEKEIQNHINSFEKEQEFFSKKNIHFYYKTPKLKVVSAASTKLSLEKPNDTFILIYNLKDKPGFVKVSARNQSGTQDMNLLMKKGVEGLQNAVGGGHPKAAGGDFMKKDLQKFKENILK